MASFRRAFGRKFCSRVGANGMGVSSELTRMTGASRDLETVFVYPGADLSANTTGECIFMKYQYPVSFLELYRLSFLYPMVTAFEDQSDQRELPAFRRELHSPNARPFHR